MPDYELPGVFVEETGLRATAIEGVKTGIAGFAGLSARGPAEGEMPVLGSFAEFEQHYGGFDALVVNGKPWVPYLAHAAHAFFANGGRHLYVARVSRSLSRARERGMVRVAAPSLDDWKGALGRLQENPAIAVIAAPGASALGGTMPADVNGLLAASADASGAFRFAVLDPPPGLGTSAVQAFRKPFDTRNAAIYYPWIRTENPPTQADPAQPKTVDLPPSGFVCGIYARSGLRHGAYESPANEVVAGAIGLQRTVNAIEQEVLNPQGINCIREFTGRGIRVWGARTLSSDPEWKYLDVRRYVTYLEHSIDRGTQWAALEHNGEALWARIRNAVDDFLHGQWKKGELLGSKPQEAFFVKCDHSTMTQNDLDDGRLVCLVGVAVLKPAEFAIFRIGRNTADCPA